LRILLIMPDGKINKMSLLSFGISFREAPLTLTTLAALIPAELKAEVQLVDRSIGQKIPYNNSFDLVGISLMTGTSQEGYQIADRFRKLGVPVVLGGVHVSLKPEEALEHADAIVSGFGEQTWPELLRDFSQGLMKKHYHAEESDLSNLPTPRRDLQRPFSYMLPNTVFITRGCRGSCEFCSVPAAKFGFHKRPIANVIDEIRDLPTRRFAISDVHVTDDVEYAKELFRAMIPLKKKWGALASTRVAKDPELLELMQAAGCSYLLLGFESFNDSSLKGIHKGFNKVEDYKNVVDTLHRYGIVIQGCFIFGFDEDDKDIFKKTVSYVNELKIDIPRYALFTPYPGTRAFERLEAEDRLLHREWGYYDTQHVVLKPKLMTPRELDEGLLWAYKETFRVQPSFKRSLASGGPAYVTFIGNLAYKLYIRRLERDRNRFPSSVLENIDARL
jgi:radical SAM superfamily enzyme YgiQ (UPF0313 family)